MPAIGGKECIYNLNLAFLDPGDVALASDPGYPVYTGGPLLAGAEPVLMPLLPERGFVPDLGAIPADDARARAADLPQLPEQPHRRGRARRASSTRWSRSRARHDMLVVHDNAYSRADLRRLRGAELPGDAGRDGGRRRGLLAVEVLQHDRLALRGDRRQRRGGRALLAAEDERRLGPVRGGPARRRGGARPARRTRRARCARSTQRRRDLVLGALREIGIDLEPPKGTIYVWAPVPEGQTSASFAEEVLERAGAWSSARARPTGPTARASSGSR